VGPLHSNKQQPKSNNIQGSILKQNNQFSQSHQFPMILIKSCLILFLISL